MSGEKGLNFVTLTPGCGYGDAACQYIAGLHRLGVPVTWTPTVANSARDLGMEDYRDLLQDDIAEDLMQLLRRPIVCSAMMIDVPPFHWQRYWREKSPELRPFTYIAWEIEQVPEDWVPALNLYERVFVPSVFNQRALIAAGVRAEVEVVPHVAREVVLATENNGADYGVVADEDFVFYTIGSWTSRKAMEETLRAYLDAFTADDKVALIVKTEPVDQMAFKALPREERESAPPHVAMVWWNVARMLASYKNPAKVHLIAEPLPAAEIDRLHRRGDCFISLTHSEGWGLGPFDAALHGNPSIITGWGGHLDYLGEDYPLLIAYEMEQTSKSRPDGCYLHAETAYWARANPQHAVELMRSLFKNQSQAKTIGEALRSRVSETFAAERVCRRLATLMGFEVKP